METTVYAELSQMLAVFADEHNLILKYDPLDKEHPDEWGITLYNKSRTWGYRRLFSAFNHEMANIDKYEHAEMILEDIRKRLKEKGVNAF